jgi:hypothetical protein
MEFYGKHTTLSQLSRYADEALEPAERLRVEAHLRDCHRCRGELAFMHKIGHAARKVSPPRPPSDLLDRIQTSRASGHRVILPVETPSAPPRRRGLALVPLALLLATGLTLGGLGLLSPDARAGASTLTFEFTRDATAPRTVHVEYRGAFGLTGETELRLRGRYRTASHLTSADDPGIPIEGVLVRHPAGTHHTSVPLPPSAVYAFFAVEDLTGETIDTNAGRFWEVLARDEEGYPLYEALRQKFVALEARDWMGALETARRMTELYPKRAEGWWHRFSYERELASGSSLEDLIDSHRARLAVLERTSLAETVPDVQQLGSLVEYARVLGDEDALGMLSERLEAVHPTHASVVLRRTAAVYSTLWSKPSRLLEALEQEWHRSGPVSALLVEAGYEAALREGGVEAIVTWADRFVQVRPSESATVALGMLEIDGLRSEAMSRVRRELVHLDHASDADRGLAESAGQHRRAVGVRRATLLAGLGRALATEGQHEAAIDTLRLSVADVWDIDLYRQVADTEMALGERADAVELYARIVADPLTPASESDALCQMLGSAATGATWEARVARSESELVERLVGDPIVRAPSSELALTDLNGQAQLLFGQRNSGPAVLVYWTLPSLPQTETIDELERARAVLSRFGVPLSLVLRQPATPHIGRVLEESGATFGVLLDPHGQLLGEFDTWLHRQHLVLDARGRLHLQHGTLADAMRHAVLETRQVS